MFRILLEHDSAFLPFRSDALFLLQNLPIFRVFTMGLTIKMLEGINKLPTMTRNGNVFRFSPKLILILPDILLLISRFLSWL